MDLMIEKATPIRPGGQGTFGRVRTIASAFALILLVSCGSGPSLAGLPLFEAFTIKLVTGVESPTQASWGSDGRLYVATLSGDIHAYTLDANYNVVDEQVIDAVAELDNPGILGITGSPFDPPGTVSIYVAHAAIYSGGDCPPTDVPYHGQVSRLDGPDFDTVVPVVTGLPASTGAHGVNGLFFSSDGDLLIAQGGVTNAGVPHCSQGGLPASPLSGAILRARVFADGFDGAVSYVEREGGAPNSNQAEGDLVELESDEFVSVFAAGMRNPFDLIETTAGVRYATDNGANLGQGDASTGADTSTSLPGGITDELNLLEAGNYYGHANRNRGIDDARQLLYHGPAEDPIEGVLTQPIALFPASTDGITEYRASTFGGIMRGALILQRLIQETYIVRLSEDGESVEESAVLFDDLGGLDIVDGPGGALLSIDFSLGRVRVATPNDPATFVGLTITDIFPWRAPRAGGNSFVLSGSGFLPGTKVYFGTAEATSISVTPRRITGTIPDGSGEGSRLIEVRVVQGAGEATLSAAFLYLDLD